MPDLTDADIGRYYDHHQAHLVADLPSDGRAHIRQHYIEGARQNPEALRQIQEELDRDPRPAERMTREQLHAAIDTIPNDGWWKPDGRDTFRELADQLADAGLTPEKTLEVLESAYGAVAGEFGS